MMRHRNFIAMSAICTLVFGLSSRIHANILGLFPGGAGCKSAAMESAGDCTDAQTLLYNPAVMSNIDAGLSAEAGLGRLQYSYEHPNFDPVRADIKTPVVSGGWIGRFAESRGSWGIAFLPSSMADLKIKGMPRRVDGSLESLNVRATRKQFHLAAGASYAFPETGMSLGLSLIDTYDNRTLKGAQVTNSGTPLVEMKASGNFIRPVIGTAWTSDSASAGVGYMFPVTKRFKGKTKLAFKPKSFNTEQVDYDPAMLLTSARVKIQDATLSANVNRVFGSKGRGIQRDGLSRQTKTADLKDANHVGVRGSYKISGYGELSLAAAYLDSYWGDGSYYTDQDGIPHQEIGHIFGQFNAIPVRNQAVSWKQTVNDWQTVTTLYRTAGATTVGPGGDNPGYYQIEFLSLTCGVQRVM